MKKLTLFTLFVSVLATFGATTSMAGKQSICHFPANNPDNWHTIVVSDNAVDKHIEKHGDLVGSCSANCDTICDDGDFCTQDVVPDFDQCICQAIPRSDVDCDDGNECTADSCSTQLGACVNDTGLNDGNVCDDLNPETTFEYCMVGSCVPLACQPTLCTSSGTCINDDFFAISGFTADVVNFAAGETFITSTSTGGSVCYTVEQGEGNLIGWIGPDVDASSILTGDPGLLSFFAGGYDDSRMFTELVTTPGATYRVTFEVRRIEFGGVYPERHSITVLAENGSATVVHPSTASATGTFEFMATGTLTTLRFDGALCGPGPNPLCNSNQDMGLDNLKVEKL